MLEVGYPRGGNIDRPASTCHNVSRETPLRSPKGCVGFTRSRVVFHVKQGRQRQAKPAEKAVPSARARAGGAGRGTVDTELESSTMDASYRRHEQATALPLRDHADRRAS